MTFAAIVLIAVKILADITFGHKALKEVREFRIAVTQRLDGIDTRLDKIEEDIK
jgi:hypothetical protein